MAAGCRKKTSGVHFFQKRGLFSLLNFRKFRQMFLLILTLFRMLKIADRVILKIRNSSFTAALLMSRTMKIRKSKLFYCQKNARYRAKELWRDIFLGNLSLKEGKNSVSLPVLILEFWWRHVQTKNWKNQGCPNLHQCIKISIWKSNTLLTSQKIIIICKITYIFPLRFRTILRPLQKAHFGTSFMLKVEVTNLC